MKRILGGLCVLALAGVLTLVAFFGKGVNKGQDNVNTPNAENQQKPILFSDYNPEDVVALGEYKNLTVDVSYTPVKDADVVEYINAVLKQYPGHEKTDDLVVDKGDIVDLNYVGKLNDKVFDESKNVYLGIGSKKFIDGFEDGLIGAKVGDTVTLTLTFPKDYKDGKGNISELAGKETVFTVTINAIVKEVIYTYDTITDGYCYTYYGFKTKQELYDYVKKMMESDMESQKKSNTRLAVLDGVVKRSTILVPAELVEYQTNQYINSLKADIEAAGYDFAKYLATYYKSTEEAFYKDIYGRMKESVEEQFVLLAIGKAEGITLDEKGFAEYVASYVKYYGYASEEALYADYPKEELQNAYLCNDVLDYLLKNTTINYVEKEAEQQ